MKIGTKKIKDFPSFGNTPYFDNRFAVDFAKLTLQGFRMKEYILLTCKKGVKSVKLGANEIRLYLYITPKASNEGIVNLIEGNYIARQDETDTTKNEYWINPNIFN